MTDRLDPATAEPASPSERAYADSLLGPWTASDAQQQRTRVRNALMVRYGGQAAAVFLVVIGLCTGLAQTLFR